MYKSKETWYKFKFDEKRLLEPLFFLHGEEPTEKEKNKRKRENALQRTNTLQHTATHCNTLHHTATHCNTQPLPIELFIQHTATLYNMLQLTATPCNTLQHSATHYNTLQHTATIPYARHAAAGTKRREALPLPIEPFIQASFL